MFRSSENKEEISIMASVSILMPVYNSKKYLIECFESIRKQSFKDFEVLMIDDGSTDGSGEICDRYCNIDSRFHVRHNNNQGAGVARNLCLDWAMETDSFYIVWVDADDLISPNYLYELVNAIRNNPTYSIVQCELTTDLSSFVCDSKQNISFCSIDGAESLLTEMQSGKHGIAFTVLWNKIYKKEIFDGIRVYIDNKISGKIYNDVNMLWRIYIKAPKCLLLNSVLYFYRYVDESIQHRKFTNQKLEFIDLYKMIYSECIKLDYNNYCTFLGERLLFSLAFLLSANKDNYINYNEFYNIARLKFKEAAKIIAFKCSRFDLKLLFLLGRINFIFFRIYGILYKILKKKR